jgi:hypothetical protein
MKIDKGVIEEVQTYHSLNFGSIDSETGEQKHGTSKIVVQKDRFSMILLGNVMRDITFS